MYPHRNRVVRKIQWLCQGLLQGVIYSDIVNQNNEMHQEVNDGTKFEGDLVYRSVDSKPDSEGDVKSNLFTVGASVLSKWKFNLTLIFIMVFNPYGLAHCFVTFVLARGAGNTPWFKSLNNTIVQ